MRDNYDFSNAQKNPYAERLRKQITINLESEIVDYFKQMAEQTHIPYQTLINMYLADCVSQKRQINITWQ